MPRKATQQTQANGRVKLAPPKKQRRVKTGSEIIKQRIIKDERIEMALDRHKAHTTGAPLKYREGAHDRMVEDLRLLGCTREQIAAAIGINQLTLSEWMDKFPLFHEAFYRGGDLADAAIARKLWQRANGYSHPAEKIQFDKEGGELRASYIEHYPPDTAAINLWLTNRQRALWKARQSTEISGPDGEPLQVPQLIVNPVMVKKD